MRLRSVTINGFKSFGNRVTIEFSDGVTAVVGPNGSGKSNVLEAIKWATGGGRARAFRAEERTDLIFHGATGKRGLGYAEVEVELSHGSRSLSIRRDLDRDGASKLKLNGATARFIDVDEALAGSGLGTSGVAIIGQGEVAGVLMADPEDLLQYVAEAAGVARLSSRREQTVSRLQTARSHLARLEDVLIELRAEVARLRAEAEDAERSEALAREALRLRVTAAEARSSALRAEVAELRGREGAGEQALLEGRSALDTARAAVARSRYVLGEAEVRYREAMAETEQKRGAAALASAERERARERLAAAEGRLRELAEEIDRLEATPEPVVPTGDPAELGAAAEAAEAAAEQARVALGAAEATLGERAGEVRAARAAAAASERAWASYDARRRALEEQLASAREQLAAADVPTGEQIEGLARAAITAREEAAAAEAALVGARDALEAAHAAHARAEAEAQALERDRLRLKAALEARQGYAQGPRQALTSRIPGVIGSVADLITVPGAYALAIAAALGRRAEYVVVRDATTGERVLEHVRRAGGWVTVLPLDLARGGRSATAPAARRAEGVLGAALELITVDESYRGLMESLLGDTLVMERLAHATALARAMPARRPRLVTQGGDIVDPGGAMSGGRRGGGVTVLGAAKELEAAEAAAAAARVAAADARTALEAARADERAAVAAALAVRARERAIETEHTRAVEVTAAAERRQAETVASLERATAALAALAPPDGVPAAEAAADLERAEAAFAEAEAARTAAERSRGESESRAAHARQAAAVLAERWGAYEVALERAVAARERLAEVRESAGAQRALVARARDEAEEADILAQEAERAVPIGLGEVREGFERAREAVATADSRLDALTRSQVDLGRELEETRVALARREAALEAAQEERSALPPGIEPLDLGERAARGRLREVEAELERLGPVNHRAAHEHAARRERLENLEVDTVQAVLAVTDLEATLERIDRETTAALAAALADLRGAFREHVRALFGHDALGEIDVEHDGPRPVGLRIRLQPPGKQTQSLGLLSVGERTMGALAFLFALMAGEGNRLPIAVLDEVDAPLDEANIKRFGDFLTSLAATGTQFVLVTHQKATFEVADTIHGVTTEDGVSRVFSIRRDGRHEPPSRSAQVPGEQAGEQAGEPRGEPRPALT